MTRVRFALQPALDAARSAERSAAQHLARSRAELERARVARVQAVSEERELRLAAPSATRTRGERFAAAGRACALARGELELATSTRRAYEVLHAAFEAARRRQRALRESAAYDEANAHRATTVSA
jgi:flagellar biosynthesis chaperone FliJ